MRQDEQIRLIRAAMDVVRSKRPDMRPEASRVPVSVYSSPERLAREREVLFRRFPMVVGFGSQVARPGDFLTHDASGVPVLVTRGSDGALRAFLNVCRHRGSHVALEPSGRGCERFRCRFHGWTYSNEGRLLGLPGAEGFPHLEDERRGLVELPVAERCGVVFVVLTPGAPLDIDAYLGQIGEDLASFGLGDAMMVRPSTRTRALNWKLYMDVTQEIYHLETLHKTTAGKGYFHNLSMLEFHRPHCRMLMPMESILGLEGTDPQEWNILEHCGILYGIFPNTTILVHAGYAQVLSTFPVDVGTATLRGGMLVPKGPVTGEDAHKRKLYYDTYWATMEEDIEVCESMQQGFASGANEDVLFGRQEGILGLYHAAVEAALVGELVP